MADQDPFGGLRTGPWVGVNNDPLFQGLTDENTVTPGGVIEDQSITNAKIVNLNADKIDAGTLKVTGTMTVETSGVTPQLEIGANGTIMRDNVGNTVLEINGATTTLNADIINAGTINGSLVDVTNINADNITTGTISAINVLASTITNDPAGVGLLIQGDGVGVDAGFGGVNDAVIYAGYNATTVDNAIANAPNSIYLSPTSVTLPDYTTGSGIQVVGDVGASIVGGTQALIGTSNVPLTGNTAYFGPSVFGGWEAGSTIYAEIDSVNLIAGDRIVMNSGTDVDITSPDTAIHSSSTIMLDSPSTTTSGDMTVDGSLTVGSTVFASVPTGSVTAYLGAYNNLPAGWLLCNGSYVDRTTYAALFAVIGTSYGTTTASNFRLPDLLGYMMVGGTSTLVPGSGSLTGSADSYLNATWDHDHAVDVPSTTSSSDSHSHTVDPAATASGTPSATFTLSYAGGAVTATIPTGTHTHSTNIASTTSSSDAHTHTVNPASFTSGAMSVSPTQKRARVNYIIKY